MDQSEEARLIAQVADRVGRSFPNVSPGTVSEIVESVHGHFEQARIRDFVPLLVERETKAKLTLIATETAG